MSDDDLDSLLDDVESGDEDTNTAEDLTEEDEDFASDESSSDDDIQAEEESMVSDDDSMEDGGISQAEVYENLKRIGELEDEKKRIQEELQERTEQLRPMLKHVDPDSILYKMLESALADASTNAAGGKSTKKTATKAAAKKAPKKKGRR